MTEAVAPARTGVVRPGTEALPLPARIHREPAQAPEVDRREAARPSAGVARNASTEIAEPGSVAARSGVREPRREYIVMIPQSGEMAAGRSTFTDGVLRSMSANMTEQQRALTSERRGRYVAYLTDQQVEMYRNAGLNVIYNAEVSLPQPVAGQAATDEFRPEDAVSNPTHGVDQLQQEPGWTGAGVLVVIADTGIAEHPDLSTPVLFDDVFTDPPEDPQSDGQGHGTHVSGISTAIGDNETGVRGVAPDASLAGAKVLNDFGGGTFASVMAGIERAIEWSQTEEWADRPVVLNMSLGATASGDRENDPLAQLINEAVTVHGIFVATSAGNSGPGQGTVGTPAVAEHAAAVAATDHWDTVDPSDDEIASFSSRGDPNGPPGQSDKPDIAAGGVFVNSTIPGGGYARFSGTSMASPQVAGAAAVLLGRAQELYDQGMFRVAPRDLVRSGELLRIMQETAYDLPDPEYADGAGDLRLDAAAALMLERHSLLHIVERETAFREIIDNLQSDDDQLDSRDNVEILQAVSELVEGVDRAGDRIELMGRMRAIYDDAAASLAPETNARISSVMEDLASEAAFMLANEPELTTEEAVNAWSTLVSWRTPAPEEVPAEPAEPVEEIDEGAKVVAETEDADAGEGAEAAEPSEGAENSVSLAARYGDLTAAEATELLRLFDTAAANLSDADRIAFANIARSEVAGAEFDGWDDLDQAIRAQAYGAYQAIARAPADTESAVANLSAYSELLESDPELSNRAKTRMVTSAFTTAVAQAPMEMRYALASQYRDWSSALDARAEFVIDMNPVVDQVLIDTIQTHATQGFSTAAEALEMLQTAWTIHVADGERTNLEDGEFYALLQRTIDASRQRFVQLEAERQAFMAGTIALLETIKPDATDAEAMAAWSQLRVALSTRVNEALRRGM